jgi:hypothetical protein
MVFQIPMHLIQIPGRFMTVHRGNLPHPKFYTDLYGEAGRDVDKADNRLLKTQSEL